MGITNFVYNLIENIITLANKYFNLAFLMCLFITWKQYGIKLYLYSNLFDICLAYGYIVI